MGRVSIIPQLETKIGQPLKPWLADKLRAGKPPQDIAQELDIGKSALYNIIKEFDLKSVQKEARKTLGSGMGTEFSHYIDMYMGEKETSGISLVSIKKDKELWHSYTWWLDFTKNPLTLASILDDKLILTFYTYLQTNKERFGRTFKGVAGKQTISTYRKRMAAFVHWLQFKRIISQEPSVDPFKRMMKIKIPSKLPEDLPDEILKKGIASFDNSFEGIRDRTIVEWFLETGMRLGGVSNLKMNRFDWQKGVGKVIEKGNKERTIVLSDKLKTQFQKYLELREPRAKSLAVWVRSDGKPLTDSGIYQMISGLNDIPGMQDELARLAPGQRWHPHVFRHIWAKYLALSEVPGFAMMVMGGWTDLKLVQHYAAAYAQEKAWSYINKASPLSNIV